MNNTKTVLVGALTLAALAAPVSAQLVGREIDLNRKQGRIGFEQSEWLIIEGRKDQPGAKQEGYPGDRIPKAGDERLGKPEDLVTSLLDDPSETPPDPKAKPEDDAAGPETPSGLDDFEGGEKSGSERFKQGERED